MSADIKLKYKADIKLSKAQISETIQSGGFLDSLLSKLAGPLGRSLLIPGSLSDPHILLFNTNFSAYKLITD